MYKIQSRDLYTILNGDHPEWPKGLDSNLRHFSYNALDSAVTLRVHNRLSETLHKSNTPHARTSYQFVRAMQGPALDMMLRGIAIQQKVRSDETERYLRIREAAQATLDKLADAVWGPETYIITSKREIWENTVGRSGKPLKPKRRIIKDEVEAFRPRGLNPNSNPQMLAFFNIALSLPVEYEIRKTPHGTERTPSANDKALKKWAAFRTKGPGINVRDHTVLPVKLAQPFVSLILTIRDADKMLSVLRSPLDADGRMRCSYNVVGTENGRWCVSGDHEVLSREGWVDLSSWSSGEIVQWNPYDGSLEYLPAKAQEFNNDKPLISIQSRRVSLHATAEHKQPYYTGKGQLLVGMIGDKSTLHSVPVGGKLKGTFAPENVTRACVMMQADGCNVNKRLVRFHFSRPRKIERCLSLLNELAIHHTTTLSRDGTTYIYIYSPPPWLQIAKFFGPWLLHHDPSVFCDELKHWDGSWTGTATDYSTKEASNAEWVKTMGHLNGQFTSVFKKDRTVHKWADSYRCTLTQNTTTRFGKDMYQDLPEIPAKVYCPETVTGFFLIRHNGQIIVTGNSSSKNAFGRGTNLQNVTPTMRRMFCADDGQRFISTDLEQAESRVVAGLVWQSTGDRTYWDACLSGDLHTTVARMTWPELEWSDDPKHNRKIADSPCPGFSRFSYRDVSKRLGHGSNYRGSSFGIAQAVGVSPQLVSDFQGRYFRAFPGIPLWHTWVINELRTHQYLDTPLGRRRWFFGRPTEDSTIREAIAFGPQSTVGELLNLVMLNCWYRSLLPTSNPKYLPIQLLLQNHDAFAFQTPLSTDLPSIIAEVNSEFQSASIPLIRGDQHESLVIPGEFVTGFNWAYKENSPNQAEWKFKDGNPDGLTKWKGSDTRTRTQSQASTSADWLSRPVSRVY